MALLSRAFANASALMRGAEWGTQHRIPGPSEDGPGSPAGGLTSALAVSTVLACVKALHDDVKVMPFAAFRGRRDGAHSRIPQQPLIVTEPFGPDVSAGAGMAQLVVSVAMRGNAYAYVVSTDSDGLPTQLLILHPDAVRVAWDEARGKHFVVNGAKYGTTEVKHITGLTMPGAREGVDMLSLQRTTHDLARKVGQYGASFFDGGGSPAGVISVPGSGNRAKAREVRESWESAHGGVVNAHRPAVMFGGATWTQMTVTPENAQFLETRRFLREEICGLYGVPLQRIQAIIDNASQGGGAGLDAIDAQYVKHGLLPAVSGIEQAWDRMVPGGEVTWTRFELEVFLRASAATRASIGQIHRVGGIRTPDEIRADEGWEPLADGKGADPHTPLNSNVSPAGGASNDPAPGGQGGPTS